LIDAGYNLSRFVTIYSISNNKLAQAKGGGRMRLDIKLAIVKSGRPQYDIAQELGVPESTLSKFVRGRAALRPEQERKLMELLGLRDEPSRVAQAAL
jgi:hypothetical protein